MPCYPELKWMSHMLFPLKLLLMPTQNSLHSEIYRISKVSSRGGGGGEEVFFGFAVGTTSLFPYFRPLLGISLIAKAFKGYYILSLIFLNDCPK